MAHVSSMNPIREAGKGVPIFHIGKGSCLAGKQHHIQSKTESKPGSPVLSTQSYNLIPEFSSDALHCGLAFS